MTLKGEIFLTFFCLLSFFVYLCLNQNNNMVNTIHRSVVEKLQIEVPDTSGSDEIFGASSKLIETDEEHFKESLKNNVNCYVHRETFVVEHDTEKNKIIFKKYFVRKNPVEIKKLKTLRLKTYKTYTSLAIDIATGEFSVYKIESGTRKRKPKPTIRQTVFTAQVASIIEGIFEVNLIDKFGIHDGLDKGLSVLGYKDKITEILSEDYLKRVFRDDSKRLKIGDFVNVFLMFNYFRKLNVILPEACSILEYSRNFRNDKKDYSGKTVYNYYSKYFDVDEEFITNLFGYLEQLNTNIYYNNKGKTEANSWFTSKTTVTKENYYSINENALTILYKLGYSSYEIKNSEKLFKLVYSRDGNTIGFYLNPSNLPLDILIENKDFFKGVVDNSTIESGVIETVKNMLNTMRVLHDVYGIKVNTDIMYYKSIDGMLLSLSHAVEKTGLYTVSQPFLNRLKKQLPKKSKCSITKHINKKIINEDINSLNYISYQDGGDKRCATILIAHKSEKMRLMVHENFINHRIYDRKIMLSSLEEKSKTYVLDRAFGKFYRNYNKNKNKEKYVGLKAHYSRKEFERLLKEKYSEKDFKSIIENLVYLR
jgi:hypothetical protein